MHKLTISTALVLALTSCVMDDAEPDLSTAEQRDIVLPPISRSTANIVEGAVGDPVSAAGTRRYWGISVVVIRNGVRSYHHFGQAVNGTNTPPNNNTLYAIGSVTKTFTGAALARLDKENTVLLGDNLDYLLTPEYSLTTQYRAITATNLATMHSGLPKGAPGGEGNYRTGSYSGDMNKLLETLESCPSGGCPTVLPPWADEAYSNYGFAVLGEALTRNSGYTTFQGLLSNKVLYPLDMFRTNNKANLTDPSCVVGTCTYSDYGDCTYAASCNGTFSKNAAAGYHKLDNGTWHREASPGSNDNIKAASGVLWSTPSDMATWLQFNMGLVNSDNSYLNAARSSIHVIRTLDGWGLGWKKTPYSYGDVWWKGGALAPEAGATTDSFTAFIGFNEDSNDGVVVMANSAPGVKEMGFQILEDLAK